MSSFAEIITYFRSDLLMQKGQLATNHANGIVGFNVPLGTL